jgi:hypothetical protein
VEVAVEDRRHLDPAADDAGDGRGQQLTASLVRLPDQ